MNTQVKRNARNSLHKERGFSVIELVAVVSTMIAVLAMAIVQLQPAIQQLRANNAKYSLGSTLRFARQAAIAQRRAIRVEFIGSRELKLTRMNQPAGTTEISDVFLSSDVSYQLTAGAPDTPDGFGNGGAIVFGGMVGGPPVMQFQSDGTFVDGNGNPINGTVFLGIPNITTAARAVTVLGATGRVHSYQFTGTTWSR